MRRLYQSRRGEWQRMGELIDDDVLHTFAIIGPPRQAGEEVRARFGGLVDRLQVGVNGDTAEFAELFDALRASNGSLPSAVQSHHAPVRKFLFSA